MRLIAYADGASRSNPGPASYGFALYDSDGTEVFARGNAIGKATNNVAEYQGAIAAVEAALDRGATELELRLDSALVVNQIMERWKVKKPHLKPFHQRLKALSEQFEDFQAVHVRRELNARADALANEALDRS